MLKCKQCAPLFLLMGALIVLFFPVLFAGKTLFLRDITYLFHPWKALCSEMVIKGQVPLWNNYACSGMPLLANWQTGVFYPFSILFYTLPFSLALKFYQVLHLFLAGLFAWLFMRSRAFSRWPSLTTAAVISLNGYFLTRLEFLSHIGVDAWFFALLLFAGNPLLLALTLSISFFAGHQIFFVAGMLLLFYFMMDSQYSPAVALRIIGVAAVLFAGLCACQLLPTMELSRFSGRISGGIDAVTAMVNSLQLRDIPGLLSPLLFPSTMLTMAGEKFPWAGTFYIGIAGCLAAVPSLLLLSRKKLLLFASVITVTGILLSLGNSTLLYPWLYKHIYIFRLLRYPSQFMLLAVVGMAILAGCGTERLRFKYLVAVAVLAELLLTGIHFQATADDGYFTRKPESAAFLQAAPGARFMLSPGTESDRYTRGKDLEDSWQGARALLYGMTGLPYHLANAFGVGDPLTPASIETLADQAYRAGSAPAAIQGYTDMGVRYLVCKERLSDAAGYTLIYDAFPFIYQIDSLPSAYAIAAGTATVTDARSDNGKIFFRASADVPSVVLWKETFFPGWETYINGKKAPAAKGKTAFRNISIPSRSSNVYQVYRPVTFMLGVWISIICIIGVSMYALLLSVIRRRRGEFREGI